MLPLPRSLELGETLIFVDSVQEILLDVPQDFSGKSGRLGGGYVDLSFQAWRALADLFADDLERCGRVRPPIRAEQEASSLDQAAGYQITFRYQASVGDGQGAEEAYRIKVEPNSILVEASHPQGAFYATRSLLQLLLNGCSVGTVVEDQPRYGWRGAHLDVSRHYYPVSFIKKFIDWLALLKLNVFHWHLTDDQGWRIEIDAFPRLIEVASKRNSSVPLSAGYYSKAEVREIVDYARERYVEVIPEIELPGHAVATLAAYPELACVAKNYAVETNWGIFKDVYCAGSTQVFEFLDTVLEEVIELFPSRYVHIGGDEVPKERWRECTKCQQRLLDEQLANEEELQSWFVSRMSRFLSERGRQLVGWDEILEGGLAEGATVMSWRGTEGGVKAAQMGHDVVMSPTSHCYLDYKQSDDEDEPGAWFAPALPLEDVYAYEPTPKELSAREAEHILGVQGNIWTERMPTEAQVEFMAFPRLCAIAEVGWSSDEKNFADFQQRLKKYCELLDIFGLRYRGSSEARPLIPTEEEKEQHRRAMIDRQKSQSVAAYS
ncbi:MAG: beta-N-acetylhexosaminidase [Polyangiaceae bacterium]|nr:beta-N-acetylhexosaminidase [Polyangiaceae bacterium]